MGKIPLIITENDRQNILSMYGLLTEEKRIIKITGKTIGSDVGVSSSFIELLDKNKNKLTPSIRTQSDIDGNYEINVELDNGKYFLSAVNTVEGYTLVFKEFNVVSNKNNYEENILFEIKRQEEVKLTAKKPNISGKITNTKGNVLRFVKITWQSEKTSGKIKQKIDGTYDSNVPLNFTITFERPNYETFSKQIDMDLKNNQKVLDVTLKPNIIVKVIDSITKTPIKDVKIQELSKKTEYVTDENGNTKLEGDYEIVSLVLRKDGYKTKTEEFDISQKPENIVIKLQSKTDDQFSIGDEPIDLYRDSMFYLYGRGVSDISDKESIRAAKLDAINKYIKKHKRVYKNLPNITNLDYDIDYTTTYGRPLLTAKKINKYFNIIRISKKDIKNYLNQFIKKENIKIESQPFEFENLTLSEAIMDAYRYGKEIFVIVGLKDDELTIEKINNLKKSGIDKKYLPIFISVDTNNSDYIKLRNIVKFNSYPRVIILKPKTGYEVEVLNSDF
jgi:hypothetical protein